MHRSFNAKVVATLAAGCVLVVPFSVAAQNGGGSGAPVIDDSIHQDSWAEVVIDQLSDSNSGWNEQSISTTQDNGTGQSARR